MKERILMKSSWTGTMVLALMLAGFAPTSANATVVRLEDLDLSKVAQEFGAATANNSVNGKPLTVAKKVYPNGIGSHAKSVLIIQLDKMPVKFHTFVGLDDETLPEIGSAEFKVIGDETELWSSGIMKTGTPAKECTLDVKDVSFLTLVIDPADNGNCYDHANWLDTTFTYDGDKVLKIFSPKKEEPYILTPKTPEKPRINGAKIFGVCPGHAFLYRIPATGKRPMEFDVENLPEGLKLDKETGIITGKLAQKGETIVTFVAKNSLGTDKREFKIVCGDRIALTPPMGWNSWNCFGGNLSEAKARTAAKVMVDSGLINYGYNFLNLDDYWSMKPTSKDKDLLGEERDAAGNICINKRFKDMKALYDYFHSLGLKGGIYSSPGPYTCGRCTASYDHEFLDVRKFEEWGVDYIKYDWCTYTPDMEKTRTRKIDWSKTPLEELAAQYPDFRPNIVPYALMGSILRNANRDIVFSLCQYGNADVWKWGDKVYGNCWRTSGDIDDTWSNIRNIWKKQYELYPYAGPGHWNDPDMLAVGPMGWGNVRPCRLTPSEQYSHYTLWAILNSPLLLGCDLTKLDEFTMNIIANNEVIDINQDTLGQQAKCIKATKREEFWTRNMEDGSIVIAAFNVSESYKTDPLTISVPWNTLGISQKPSRVRDVWRQQDLVSYDEKDCICKDVPVHGVTLLRIWK